MSGTADIDRIQRLVRSDAGWPSGLRSVEVEPSALWLRGREDLLQARRRIAIVGSRAPTDYGRVQAERFAHTLSAHGVCVVSGLARGVDEAAHRGALEGGGGTIAVLGCGVDRPWPQGPLSDRVAREGLLVSEFAPGVGPRRHHFPLRNRVLAALADAVLVVEAARASGSLITARWAADQGQAVFAVPGRVDHPLARGTLRLVREGATPVESPTMLLQDVYGETAAADAGPDGAALRSEPERSIVEALAGETLSAGEISERVGIAVGAALASLTSLDLAGVVRRGPGGLYTLR
ncbi:MAG: DNA-processing protein DprA [Planctomycetota bacterium]